MQLSKCSSSGTSLSWAQCNTSSHFRACQGRQSPTTTASALSGRAAAVCGPRMYLPGHIHVNQGSFRSISRSLHIARAAPIDVPQQQTPAPAPSFQQPSTNASATPSTGTSHPQKAASDAQAEGYTAQEPGYTYKDFKNATMQSLHQLDETPILPAAGRAHPVVPGLHFTSDQATLDLIGEGLPIIQGVSDSPFRPSACVQFPVPVIQTLSEGGQSGRS